MIAILHSGQQAGRQQIMEECMKAALVEGREVYCNFSVRMPGLKGRVKELVLEDAIANPDTFNYATVCLDRAEELLGRQRGAPQQKRQILLLHMLAAYGRMRDMRVVLSTQDEKDLEYRVHWLADQLWECREGSIAKTDMRRH